MRVCVGICWDTETGETRVDADPWMPRETLLAALDAGARAAFIMRQDDARLEAERSAVEESTDPCERAMLSVRVPTFTFSAPGGMS